jgi:hypothetical protein
MKPGRIRYRSDRWYLPALKDLAGDPAKNPYGSRFREELFVSVYRLDFDDEGRASIGKRAIGRRCVLTAVASGAAVLCDTRGGRVSGMCEGYWAEGARAALLAALSRPGVGDGTYVIRWLSIASLLIESVWLQSRAKDRPDIVRPAFHNETALNGRTEIPLEEFVAIVESLERDRRALGVIDDI